MKCTTLLVIAGLLYSGTLLGWDADVDPSSEVMGTPECPVVVPHRAPTSSMTKLGAKPGFQVIERAEESYPSNYPGLQRPVLIELARLRYPLAHPPRGRPMELEVSFMVDGTGHAREVKIDKGVRPAIDRVVRQGIEQSRFVPGQLKGRPVNVRLRVKVEIDATGWALTEVLPTAPPSVIEALKRPRRGAETTGQLNPEQQKEAHLNLRVARYFMRRRDWKKALARLLTIYTQYPQSSQLDTATRLIGDVLVKLGERKLAGEFYQQVEKQAEGGSEEKKSAPSKRPAANGADVKNWDMTPSPAEAEIITLESTLVNVPVTVRDRRGAYVTDLRRDEFTVYENKVKQRIAFFARAEEPLMVALVLDTSGSTAEDLRRIQAAAMAFVDQLRAQDRVSVVSFGQAIRQGSEPTATRALIHQAIRQTWSSGATRLYDAVFYTLLQMREESEARRAVVLLTDGVDTGSRVVGSDDVLQLAEEWGIPLYAIRYDTLAAATAQAREQHAAAADEIIKNVEEAYRLGNEFLGQLAETTGGTLYQAARLIDLPRTFAALGRELRHLYNLGYYPSRPKHGGAYRRIRVTVKRKGVRVQSRKGY